MDHSALILHITNGLTIREIATVESVCESTVVYWLKKHNLSTKWTRGGWSKDGSNEKRSKNRQRSDITKWDWIIIQNRYNEGKTLKDLCEEFGLNFGILSRAKKQKLFKSRTNREASKLAHANGSHDYSIYRTPEFRLKAAKNGGYKPRAGCGKGAWITNLANQPIYLQSSFEIRMAILLNKANILWERPQGIQYMIDGSEHRYYPDFYLPEHHIYIDTKNNYLMEKDKEKIENVSFQNNVKILMIGQNQINIDYIKRIIV